METAHDLGIKSSATMMYGTVESIEQRARHIIKIAELQKKTKGFMAFIPWSFEPNNTEINESGIVQFPMGGFELLKMISVSRIVFKGLIDHLQSSWLTNGIGMAQLAIYHGSDDFGGTLIGEEVVSATGARSTELLAQNIINAIKAMGYIPVERRNNYEVIKHF
jgi:cyclic dehypoxanthinyl futalosine synthase